jgi:hypothetical protein
MTHRHVDELIVQLNRGLNLADPESYRTRIVEGVRHILSRIGTEHTFHTYSARMIVYGHYLQMSDGLRNPAHILDIGLTDNNWIGIITRPGETMRNPRWMAMEIQGGEVYFPTLDCGHLWVLYRSELQDETGDPLIPDTPATWEACVNYCTSLLLDEVWTHPRYPEKFALRELGNRQANEARGELNPNNSLAHARRVRPKPRPNYL